MKIDALVNCETFVYIHRCEGRRLETQARRVLTRMRDARCRRRHCCRRHHCCSCCRRLRLSQVRARAAAQVAAREHLQHPKMRVEDDRCLNDALIYMQQPVQRRRLTSLSIELRIEQTLALWNLRLNVSPKCVELLNCELRVWIARV